MPAHRSKAAWHEGRQHHRLCWLSVVGGFLDGARLEFKPGLNCIIGGRGTGKTTVIELVRFALDALPEDEVAKQRIESLIEGNLAFGRVELGIETKDGLSYIVSRSEGEPPIVLTTDRKPTEIRLKGGGLFHADIFSQNEVEGIADHTLSQLDLIDNLQTERIREVSQQLQQLAHELSSNAGSIAPLQDQLQSLSDALNAQPEVEAKLKGLAAAGGADAKAINQAHAEKALRDREKRAMDSALHALSAQGTLLEDQMGRIEREARTQFTQDILAGPNKELAKGIVADLQECAHAVDAALRKAQEHIQQLQRKLPEQVKKLDAAHSAQEMGFRALIEKHQSSIAQSTERAKLEKLRNDLEAKKKSKNETEMQLKKQQDARGIMLKQLADLRHARFQIRKEVADRINSKLAPHIRISIVQDGNLDNYRALVEATLRGSKMKFTSVAEKITSAMWPSDLATLVRSGDAMALSEKAGINEDQAAKVIAALGANERLHELETVELIDRPKIELNDGGTFKDSQALSTGQKCTTILPILLMENEKPLLIDQPEDNLDNRYISETVVRNLNAVKERRQLIFVTHNANVPVLGDAARVFVLDSNGESARLLKFGTVDDCKNEIVSLLEGGEEAFKQRKKRYNY